MTNKPPARRNKRLLVSFSVDEYDRVKQLATQLRLHRSEVLRNLALGYRLPDPTDFAAAQSTRELLKINADLARLGNLLKLLMDEPLPPALIGRVDTLIAEIDATKSILKAGAVEIMAQVKPRRGRRAG